MKHLLYAFTVVGMLFATSAVYAETKSTLTKARVITKAPFTVKAPVRAKAQVVTPAIGTKYICSQGAMGDTSFITEYSTQRECYKYCGGGICEETGVSTDVNTSEVD